MTGFGSMLEFEGASLDVKVGIGILTVWCVGLKFGLL